MYHTLALVSIGNTFAEKDILNVNVVGVKNILESARKQYKKSCSRQLNSRI